MQQVCLRAKNEKKPIDIPFSPLRAEFGVVCNKLEKCQEKEREKNAGGGRVYFIHFLISP
jgi:hypothetical protein